MPDLFLSDAQRREFATNGFLVIENALSPKEIAHWLEVVDQIDQTCPTTHGGGARSAGQHLELRNAAAYDHRLLPLLDHPATFPAIVDLMGYNICMTTSHVFIRPPSPPNTKREFKAIGWHKDGPSSDWTPSMNGQWPWLYTKIGYFLTDLTIPDAGALRVVPGSHRVLEPAWKPGEADPYGSIEVKVKPGTAVIFENRLWHAVGPNYSTQPRKNIYIGYCWRWMRPIDYIAPAAELLEKATPPQRQLLGENHSSLGYILPEDRDVPLKSQWKKRESNAATPEKTAAPAMI